MGSSRDYRNSGNNSPQNYDLASTAEQTEQRYRDLQPIGSGATSTVYRATDVLRKRDVALKIFKVEIEPSSEWDTLASLNHSSIVKVYDWGRITDPKDKKTLRPYVAMELLTGVSLKREIPRLRGFKDAVNIIEKCSLAIAYVHEQGKCHLDLKPSNIHISRLVGSRQISGVTVLDFGMSGVLAGNGVVADNGIMPAGGTFAYMSPEQISGKPVNEASDVFSLGVLSYELLTRRNPFTLDLEHAQKDQLEILIKESIPPYICDLNPEVPEPIAWAVHKALAKDPNERPSATDLCLYIDTKETFDKDRDNIGAKLPEIESLLTTDVEQASKELEKLERLGWAFPEIVLLRHKIQARRADADVQQFTEAASECLRYGTNRSDLSSMNGLAKAAESLKNAKRVPSRRFDVRVLSIEARIAYERRIELAARQEYGAARSAEDQRAMRRAEWFLGRLKNLESAASALLWLDMDDAAAIADRISSFYKEESSLLDHAQGVRSAVIGPYMTKAVEARTLQVEARRKSLILKKSQDFVESFDDPERQKKIKSELDSLRGEDQSDTIEAVEELGRKYQKIVDDLKDELKRCDQAGDTPGALQAVESLIKIVPPDKTLSNRQAELRACFDEELYSDWLQRTLETLDALSEMGDYGGAVRVVGVAVKHSPNEKRFKEREAALIALHSNLESRDALVFESLEKRRDYSLDGAIGPLSAAAKKEPANHVLAVALAALLVEREQQQILLDDGKGSLNTRKSVDALLNACGEHSLLKQAIDDLKGISAQPIPVSLPEPVAAPEIKNAEINKPPPSESPLAEPSKPLSPIVVESGHHFESSREQASRRLRDAKNWFSQQKLFSNQRNSTDRLIVAALGIVALTILALGVHQIRLGSTSRGDTTKKTSSNAPSLVTLDLTPASATVQIDGGPAVSGTSISLRPGTHTIRVSAMGYVAEEESLNIGTHAIVYQRELKPSPVALSFDNTAEMATVLLDGADFSGSGQTPVDHNQHHLIARFPHYGELQIDFTPLAAAPPDVAQLPQERGFPLIVVSSFNDRATIFASRNGFPVTIDDELKGQATQTGLVLSGLSTQNGANVSIGTGKSQRVFRIEASDPPLLRIFVIGDTESGSIMVLANQDDSQISLDGQPVKGAVTGGRYLLSRVRPGDHAVALSKDGFCVAPDTLPLKLKAGDQIQAKFDLQPIPPLRIQGGPPGARVFIDGSEVSGPIVSGLRSGSHTVRVTASGYTDFVRAIQVSCGSNPTLNLAQMVRSAPPSPVVPTPAPKIRIAFSVDPPDATVTLYHSDGTPASDGPLTSPLQLDTGSYRLHGTHEGYESADWRFTVFAGNSNPDISLILPKIEQALPPPPTPLWSAPLQPIPNTDWRRAPSMSLFGQNSAAGTYVFRIRKRGIVLHKSFSSWILGYQTPKDYVEFRVDGKDLQWRTSGSDPWSKAPVRIADKSEEIYVRLTVNGKSVVTEVGDDAGSAVAVGKPLSIPEGRFGITKDTEIAAFSH